MHGRKRRRGCRRFDMRFATAVAWCWPTAFTNGKESVAASNLSISACVTVRHSRWRGSGRRWQPGPGQIDTCTILTTTANPLVAPLHDRMPAIVQPADYDRWLDPKLAEPEAVESLLGPYPSQAMEAVAVSDWVNVAGHEGPRCLAAAAESKERQQSLDFDDAR